MHLTLLDVLHAQAGLHFQAGFAGAGAEGALGGFSSCGARLTYVHLCAAFFLLRLCCRVQQADGRRPWSIDVDCIRFGVESSRMLTTLKFFGPEVSGTAQVAVLERVRDASWRGPHILIVSGFTANRALRWAFCT